MSSRNMSSRPKSVQSDAVPQASDFGPIAGESLIWDADGHPRSARFGDVYFSAQDGLAESRAVFLEGCGLAEIIPARDHLCVAELGFGTGLNMAALLMLWRARARPGARLSLFSVEAWPLSRDEAARALSSWPELEPATRALLQAWPQGTPGFHRLDLPGFNAVLDLAVGPVQTVLPAWTGQADAWFLDGFAPSANPDMWSPDVLAQVAIHSRPGARLASFTVAGAVRRGLQSVGFSVEKKPGFGRKRERLEAVFQGRAVNASVPERITVLGAGIAGASLARAFRAQGLAVDVIDAQGAGTGGVGTGASGADAALVTPRLDAGDAVLASAFAQALERAACLYEATGGAVLAHGVLQLAARLRDGPRFDTVAAQPVWPPGAMVPLSAEDCAVRLGEPIDRLGLWMGQARVIAPRLVLGAWLETAPRTLGIAHMTREDDGWVLYDAQARPVHRARCLVLACGAGLGGLWPGLPLRPVRGQLEVAEGVKPAVPVAWGGYAVPTTDGLVFGATHDRDDTDASVRIADRDRNRASLSAVLPELAARLGDRPIRSRAALRATTPDRLPMAGRLADGLYVLGGLGSRGFCVAPLLAEHVAALALNRPSPLPMEAARRFDPARFASD